MICQIYLFFHLWEKNFQIRIIQYLDLIEFNF